MTYETLWLIINTVIYVFALFKYQVCLSNSHAHMMNKIVIQLIILGIICYHKPRLTRLANSTNLVMTHHQYLHYSHYVTLRALEKCNIVRGFYNLLNGESLPQKILEFHFGRLMVTHIYLLLLHWPFLRVVHSDS